MPEHYFPVSFHIMLLSDFKPLHKNVNMKRKKHQTPFQRWLLTAVINIINSYKYQELCALFFCGSGPENVRRERQHGNLNWSKSHL